MWKTRDFRESGLVRGQVPVPGFFHFTGRWELVYCEKQWRVEWLILILGGVELTGWINGMWS